MSQLHFSRGWIWRLCGTHSTLNEPSQLRIGWRWHSAFYCLFHLKVDFLKCKGKYETSEIIRKQLNWFFERNTSDDCSLYKNDWLTLLAEFFLLFQLDQRASTIYMEQLQQDITADMRGILVDWLIEVRFITVAALIWPNGYVILMNLHKDTKLTKILYMDNRTLWMHFS